MQVLDVPLTAAAVALNRFGLGARPDDAPPTDPKRWLRDQLEGYQARPPMIAALPNSEAIAIPYFESRRQARMAGDAEAKQAIFAASRREHRSVYRAAVNARIANALTTDTPFTERLVHFWANHFAISADKVTTVPFVGTFENEAIRPHIMGSFQDLVLAVERHPGMLIYLDQASSVGPQSALAQRARSRGAPRVPGLNENLAREIMELHTLGVRSGYNQNDVTEFARALTGWSIGGIAAPALQQDVAPGAFIFRPAMHEPGERTIMGRRYGQMGEEQARAVLRDLVKAPATAIHIATKLARHFAGDDPPAALVERLSRAFGDTQGDLPTMETRNMAAKSERGQNPVALGKLAVTFLARPNGPRIAVIEIGGWDTHTRQAARLARLLAEFDAMLAAMRDGLGRSWAKTTVLVATEFGRTAAENGSGGTDHGTASLVMLIGGAVKGGRIIAEWPGLSPSALYENRDLKPTMALDAVIAGAAGESFSLDPQLVMRAVFKDGSGTKPVTGLIRT